MSGTPEEARPEPESTQVNGSPPQTYPPQLQEPPEPPQFVFELLAHGGKEVLINHNSQVYRLRATKNGKLILNK